MSDRIVLTGVQTDGTHGVLPEEHEKPQRFVVDVVLEVDLQPAGGSDDLADTVSYADVADDVVAIVEGPHVDLVETLADRMAAAALAHPGVEAVEVTVHKPDAPIPHPFADVAVRIRREHAHRFVVALGANEGDPRRTLASAVRAVAGLDGVRVDGVSDLFETDPVGGPEQPAYLNAVLVGHTRLAPATLLRRLHRIEADHGRVRQVRWGPRTLDLDLVQHGDPRRDDDVVVDTETLVLPHPRAHERGFVLVPWAQVDPQAGLRRGDEVVPVVDLVARLDAEGQPAGVRVAEAWHPEW
ncbi:2-amino-4-hydroxy-6-hydroxymethyldihydropteridine diphosphokinase [Mobilicoccus pelagius]|uniref:Bifunctional folate synthesis protein n=1 Tax=Mobilicoccus pelagius NBRC 104925 TaxID=1089455 RepID=H5US76_9MICO|nr:2-amino-4-hydroxy-6-hydroxymethyldihydropteridine diphosphokinase [Mobilicoccus pelagius]GAB48584.1 dihydroneopterin aldolase/2-amino-4-hydroxy-6-hydroxymethyldihydropteridine pyrophosphokinase [Mobilicoccus pelagius NBRC 104925]